MSCKGFLVALLTFFSVFAYAQKYQIDSLKAVIADYKAIDTNYINAINKLSYSYHTINPDSSIFLGKKALELSIKLHYNKGKALAYRFIGLGYNSQSKYGDALNYTFKSIKSASEFKSIELAAAYNNAGLIYENIGNYKSASYYYKLAISTYGKYMDCKGYANSLNNLANVYTNQGNFSEALKNHLQALIIREKLNDSSGLSFSYNNIGNIYFYQKNYQTSLNYYKQSFFIKKKLGNKMGEVSALNNMGLIYLKLVKYSDAKKQYEMAFALANKINDLEGIGSSLHGIASVALEEKNFSKAIESYEKSLAIVNQIDDKFTLSQIYRGLSKTYFELEQTEKALIYIKKGLIVAESIGHEAELRDHYRLMSKIYEKKGSFKDAFYSFEKFDEFEEKFNNDEVKKQLAQQSAQYEFNKKAAILKLEQDKRNAIYQKADLKQKWIIFTIMGCLFALGIIVYVNAKHLSKVKKAYTQLEFANLQIVKQKEEIINQKETLTQLNKTKDKLFSIISHDMRSPISNLKSLLDMVINDGLSMEEFKEFTPHLQTNIQGVSETLENLLIWSYSQINGNKSVPKKYNLSHSIAEMLGLYKSISFSKEIIFSENIDANLEVFADENQVKVLIRNLINNAIKFTCANGEIKVYTEVEKEFVKLNVKDTGKGINAEKLPSIFTNGLSTEGTKGEKGMGIGLILCKDMIDEIGGELKAESELGKGSCFSFTIPMVSA